MSCQNCSIVQCLNYFTLVRNIKDQRQMNIKDQKGFSDLVHYRPRRAQYTIHVLSLAINIPGLVIVQTGEESLDKRL